MDRNKKILIIDDDPRNIFALKLTLQARGYACASASGAEEGIKLASSDDDIGIILMDMMMPEMDGYQAISELRQMQETKSLPIISVTAQAMVGDKEKCLEAGADAYISKPIDVDQLLDVLNQF
ncbi:MAG: histidine kinase [Sphingobacteriaceae bacterium]|nr:histidine kinase [Sphingobacteriaceae bacterium]